MSNDLSPALREAVEVICTRIGGGLNANEIVTSALRSLVAQGWSVQRGPIADMFWDHDDLDNAANHISEILYNHSPGEVVRIQRAIQLSDVFAVEMLLADRSGHEIREFNSESDAEAWVASRIEELRASPPVAGADDGR